MECVPVALGCCEGLALGGLVCYQEHVTLPHTHMPSDPRPPSKRTPLLASPYGSISVSQTPF
jgi:hypothetical protein